MEELYQKYHRSLMSFVRHKIEDEGKVEELVNDILWAAIKSYPTFNQKSSEFSWICSIANHKIIDYYRKKKIKTILFSSNPLFEEIADEALSPEKDVLKNELKAEIKRTFRDISEGYEKILRLKYIDGLKVKQMAKVLKMSAKAVESKLIRAKAKFKSAWAYDRKET
jgi:RNA polymerase sigma-70 factor (ECF subfamily)